MSEHDENGVAGAVPSGPRLFVPDEYRGKGAGRIIVSPEHKKPHPPKPEATGEYTKDANANAKIGEVHQLVTQAVGKALGEALADRPTHSLVQHMFDKQDERMNKTLEMLDMIIDNKIRIIVEQVILHILPPEMIADAEARLRDLAEEREATAREQAQAEQQMAVTDEHTVPGNAEPVAGEDSGTATPGTP